MTDPGIRAGAGTLCVLTYLSWHWLWLWLWLFLSAAGAPATFSVHGSPHVALTTTTSAPTVVAPSSPSSGAAERWMPFSLPRQDVRRLLQGHHVCRVERSSFC